MTEAEQERLDAVVSMMHAAQERERDDIAAWLRAQSKGARTYSAQLAFQDAADAIEALAHKQPNQ